MQTPKYFSECKAKQNGQHCKQSKLKQSTSKPFIIVKEEYSPNEWSFKISSSASCLNEASKFSSTFYKFSSKYVLLLYLAALYCALRLRNILQYSVSVCLCMCVCVCVSLAEKLENSFGLCPPTPRRRAIIF